MFFGALVKKSGGGGRGKYNEERRTILCVRLVMSRKIAERQELVEQTWQTAQEW